MSASGFAAPARAALETHSPELAARFAGIAVEPLLQRRDGAVADILIGETPLYGGDAQAIAAAQVEAFMARPLRLFMDRPGAAGLISPVCIDLLDAMGEELVQCGVEEIEAKPLGSPTFLVVFGVGLGRHVMELARRTEARWLIVAEPIVEFLAASCHAVDWREVIAHFKAKGGGVHIVTELDPGRMASAIVRYMTAQGIPYVDGSWVFTHYPMWALAEARKRLHEAVEFAFINRGFFEDELIMMRNAAANFSARPFWLMEGRPRLHRPETAIVVGAGPSLDTSLEALRSVRDKAVLFAAGTSLRPLLRNGLMPDFHCELENIPGVYDVLAETARYGDLSQITLLASATVDPRVPPLFRDTVYFFRDSVSSTQILGRRHALIGGAAPTCVNMAVSMAAFLGFTEFMLFGTDCGARADGQRHASDTVYRDIGVWQEHERGKQFTMEVEGNFGGTVQTDWIYDASRLMLAEAIEKRALHVRNCSDGALIPGTAPCVPEAAALAGPAIDRIAIRAALMRSLERHEAGAILAECDLAKVAAEGRRMFDELEALIDELARGAPDFARLWQRIGAFIGATDDNYERTASIVNGTLRGLPRIAMFFGFRVVSGETRRRLYERFIREFRAVAAAMRRETCVLLDRLAAPVAMSA